MKIDITGKYFRILMIFLLFGFNSKVIGCSCRQTNFSLKESISKSELVFLGEVIAVTEKRYSSDFVATFPNIYYVYTFKILRSYKANLKVKYIKVMSDDYRQKSCGFEFVINKKYIVFASTVQIREDADDEKFVPILSTSKCKLTTEYSRGKNKLIKKSMLEKRAPYITADQFRKLSE